MPQRSPSEAGVPPPADCSLPERFAAFPERQFQILEQLARGATTASTLESIVLMIQEHSPGTLASVLVMDPDGRHLRHAAAADLPVEYCRAIDGFEIGPRVGSCGTAAYTRQRVFVSDIATDPLWAGYAHLALPHGLRACWSEPILDAQNQVLGTFAMYHRCISHPREEDFQIIRVAAHMAGIALDHQRREEARLVAEQHREALERKLVETQKLESLGVLAGGIAHDFNNLLTGVLGNASLLRIHLQSQSAMVDLLDGIEDASLRAADLCKQMLAYAGKGRFLLKTLDLNSWVQESSRLLKMSVSKNATLHFELGNQLPPVEADSTQLRQILMNLVINASEAIGERPGHITVSTGKLWADATCLAQAHLAPELPAGEYVFLEVSDTGPGMTEETKARIFEPFFTTKFTGRGLGLAAVIGIARSHHGALKVISAPGEGSRFQLLLPASQRPVEEPSLTVTNERVVSKGGLILVVDDEPTIQKIACRMLEASGFTTLVANDGREALALFDRHRDEIKGILLDLTMPNMNGEETFRELRRRSPDLRIVLMSGFNAKESVARFPCQDFAGFIQKPFDAEALLTKLREVLA